MNVDFFAIIFFQLIGRQSEFKKGRTGIEFNRIIDIISENLKDALASSGLGQKI